MKTTHNIENFKVTEKPKRKITMTLFHCPKITTINILSFSSVLCIQEYTHLLKNKIEIT